MRARRILILGLLMTAPVATGASCSCGDTGTAPAGASSSGSPGSGGASTASGTGGEGGGLFTDGGDAGCVEGDPCGDGGVCAGSVCCSAGQACGSICCGGVDVCSFQKCVTPGMVCVDATDCPDGQYCEYALGDASDGGAADASCQGGAALVTGKCLPKPPECPPGQPSGDPVTCLEKCEYHPPAGQFSPVVKYSWGDPNAMNTQDSVMMAPIVVELDDDNCDGVIDARDIPEIVFSTFASGNYNGNGTLHAISIINGKVVEKWSTNPGAVSPIHPGRSIAAGNIDGKPGNEIVVCTTDGRVRAYDGAGKEIWLSPVGTCAMPSIADLDQDGNPEVIVESQILDGKTGMPKIAAFTPANASNIVVSDLDGDGKLDIVTGSRAYHSDGMLFANTAVPANYVAVGDLDKDGIPEVVASDFASHTLVLWHYDPATMKAKVLRQSININGTLNPNLCPAGSAGNTKGGGPPTMADFDGDGFPDVALAGGVGYAVFSGKLLMNPAVADDKTLLWITQTQDCSSASTGSSVFDFDGDGKAEVVYGDELKLHIYSGSTGAVLFETCNTNGTLFEYPVVADVDNDGQADIVVVSNSYSSFKCANSTKTSGVRIFGDANGDWVRTRRVWNEHAYHVTNVNEDGTIPAVELPNYKQPKLDNFRQNVQPLGEFSAPDLVVRISPDCGPSYGLIAKVRNLGEAAVPAGVPIAFYAGDPMKGGLELPGSPVATTKVLYPAEDQDIYLPLPSPAPGITDGSTPIFAVVDPTPMHAWHECRTDNNTSAAGEREVHRRAALTSDFPALADRRRAPGLPGHGGAATATGATLCRRPRCGAGTSGPRSDQRSARDRRAHLGRRAGRAACLALSW